MSDAARLRPVVVHTAAPFAAKHRRETVTGRASMVADLQLQARWYRERKDETRAREIEDEIAALTACDA